MTDEHNGWYSRGYLLHLDAPGGIQHITFRLGDSLPKGAIEYMQASLAFIPDQKRAIEKRKRIQSYLDADMGFCSLGNPKIANIAEVSL